MNFNLLIMQSLREKIKLTLDQNLKSRDEIATSTVRLILAAIKDHDIQYRTKKKGDSISDEEILSLLQIIHETIKEHGFNSIKDLGKLLGFLKSKYPGQLDMQTVAEKAKTIFND